MVLYQMYPNTESRLLYDSPVYNTAQMVCHEFDPIVTCTCCLHFHLSFYGANSEEWIYWLNINC
mgnify:CR=1 FL=1